MKHSVKRSVSVSLGELASDALGGEGVGNDAPVSVSAARAIRCYLNDKGSGIPGWSFPPFRRRREAGERVALELSIEDSLWGSLEDEAESQGVSVQQMLEHAVLYFAAEVNAGRVTERILDDFDQD